MSVDRTSHSQQKTGPVGQGDYEVKEGDCIESVAFEHGLFWKTVWDAPENSELKRVRKDANRLLSGDRIHIIERRIKLVAASTERRHRFRRKGVPSQIHVVLKHTGKPRANLPYVLDIDGVLISSTTNARGEIIQPIPPNARFAKIKYGAPGEQREIHMALGSMDPITEITGVQGRLINLGYRCEAIDGQLSLSTVAAIRDFQKSVGLPSTGDLDQATLDALVKAHGS